MAGRVTAKEKGREAAFSRRLAQRPPGASGQRLELAALRRLRGRSFVAFLLRGGSWLGRDYAYFADGLAVPLSGLDDFVAGPLLLRLSAEALAAVAAVHSLRLLVGCLRPVDFSFAADGRLLLCSAPFIRGLNSTCPLPINRATLATAPLAAHEGRGLSEASDVQSLLFLLLSLTAPLPWHSLHRPASVLAEKRRLSSPALHPHPSLAAMPDSLRRLFHDLARILHRPMLRFQRPPKLTYTMLDRIKSTPKPPLFPPSPPRPLHALGPIWRARPPPKPMEEPGWTTNSLRQPSSAQTLPQTRQPQTGVATKLPPAPAKPTDPPDTSPPHKEPDKDKASQTKVTPTLMVKPLPAKPAKTTPSAVVRPVPKLSTAPMATPPAKAGPLSQLKAREGGYRGLGGHRLSPRGDGTFVDAVSQQLRGLVVQRADTSQAPTNGSSDSVRKELLLPATSQASPSSRSAQPSQAPVAKELIGAKGEGGSGSGTGKAPTLPPSAQWPPIKVLKDYYPVCGDSCPLCKPDIG